MDIALRESSNATIRSRAINDEDDTIIVAAKLLSMQRKLLLSIRHIERCF